MGNNPSAPSGQGHDQQAAAGSSTPTTASQPGSGSQSPRQSRRSARNIMSTTHNRSAVPPEASLAQARGSTVVSRPKSIPGSTAVSSLSGSPHSNASPLTSASAGAASRAATSTSGPSAIPIASAAAAGSSSIAASMEAPAPASASAASGPLPAPAPRADEPSKPVDVPRESSAGHTYPHAHFNSDLATAQSDQLTSVSSVTDTYYMTHPPRMPLPIEEEVHTPGSPILGPQDGSDIPPMAGSEGAASYSSDGLTRKGSGISTNTAEDEDTDELQVDKTRPVVPTKVEWKRGGDKVYVTGSIFQWNRKQRLHPVYVLLPSLSFPAIFFPRPPPL